MSSNDDLHILENTFVLVYFEEADPGFQFEVFPATRIVGSPLDSLRKGRRVDVKFGEALSQGMVVEVSGVPTKSSTTDKETQTEDNPVSIAEGYEELRRECAVMRAKYEEMNSLVQEMQKNHEAPLSAGTSRDTPSPSSSGSSTDEVLSKSSKSVEVGSQGTRVPRHVYDVINWSSYKSATRKLLMAVFTREELATHSLSGKPSPAFKDKELKAKLNPIKISDIVQVVTRKCRVTESLVRGAITIKCADEAKLRRKRLGHR